MALISGQNVKVSVEDRVAIVTIDHRPVNALDHQTLQELGQIVEAIEAEPVVKVVIVTGGGSLAFVAGADIKEVSQLTSPQEAQEMAALGQAVFLKLQRLSKPVIAAINGVCLGGGCELAMACHIRISGDRARFGQPEINLGIIPGWGGTQRLPRLIGKAKAIEWVLTGDMVTAQEALRLGLVNHVVPQDQVLKAAKDLARKIASKGGVAAAQALRAIELGMDRPLEQGLAAEAEAFRQVAATGDSKEGIRAFLEKRQPRFQDQ
ncbi:MAG: enoyl-CoA hydratase/isomerase family protein [Candidatus Omnitrophica bacterium]|nr:enoyl-CoA hydratase/isomerase family protein [Candidatus Omnitrophota bacterium]MBI2496326.1 enoyl-CoA hydratase/isomerase family protein [Candidatus Omnitrophota bacterium]MBI3020620.1 enoyl-CoA hydratase/isomerase family protein [Candidatus Omnitrophota bacterium]